MENNEDDDDDFHDAVSQTAEMSLERGLVEAQRAMDLFFTNQYEAAKRLAAPWSTRSLYHALVYATFPFLEAMLTLEESKFVIARDAIKQSLVVIQKYKRRASIADAVGKKKAAFYNKYTEIEVHAELCYAECLLLKGLITFLEDESLGSFLRGALKIKYCYNSYKFCQKILENRTWVNEKSHLDFESGVMLGIGMFNLMISTLPARIVKLLEFFGFSGNRETGLQNLIDGCYIHGLRQVLCIMSYLSFQLIVMYLLSHTEGDLETSEDILETQFKRYSDGAWYMFYKARLEFVKGNTTDACGWYIKSWHSQATWPEFHYFCYWELFWLKCVTQEYEEALFYTNSLLNGCKFSITTYYYQKAALMLMKESLREEEKNEIAELMKTCPKFKQRIAGKSLPLEKFVIKKSERFLEQANTLIMPIPELLYVWNLFKVLKRNYTLADNMLKLIERTNKMYEQMDLPKKYDSDNRALLHLLKGALLRNMNSPMQALESLEAAIALKSELVDDHYIVPYAIFELALTEWGNGNREKAIAALEDVRKNYTGYALESRLHFRIHTAMVEYRKQFSSSTTRSIT